MSGSASSSNHSAASDNPATLFSHPPPATHTVCVGGAYLCMGCFVSLFNLIPGCLRQTEQCAAQPDFTLPSTGVRSVSSRLSAMIPVFPSLSVSLHVRHTISIRTSLDEQTDLGLEWLLAKALMTSTFYQQERPMVFPLMKLSESWNHIWSLFCCLRFTGPSGLRKESPRGHSE